MAATDATPARTPGPTVGRGWRYVDTLPFHTPDSLDDLHGPRTGLVVAPYHIWTAPDAHFDIDDTRQRWSLYSATVRDGTPQDQADILDKDFLEELWPDLNLPKCCRDKWAAKFPELAVLPVRALTV
jgi:hypothetical protein